jgi:hypothetical protein
MNRLVDLEWDASGELFSIGIDDDGDGDADGRETFIRDPAGRPLLVIREWPDGHTERVQQIFDGLNLIEERTADGWRRDGD